MRRRHRLDGDEYRWIRLFPVHWDWFWKGEHPSYQVTVLEIDKDQRPGFFGHDSTRRACWARRPSGYEPWNGHIDQCRLVSIGVDWCRFNAIYQGFSAFTVSFVVVRFRHSMTGSPTQVP